MPLLKITSFYQNKEDIKILYLVDTNVVKLRMKPLSLWFCVLTNHFYFGLQKIKSSIRLFDSLT